MSVEALSPAPRAGALSAARVTGVLWPAAIVAIAIAIQARLGTVDDVSWLLTVIEKWFGGARLYADVIEFNPPASILLYAPAVALAHALGLRVEVVVCAFSLASVVASLALAAVILERAGFALARSPFFARLSLAVLLILPAHTFSERDDLAAAYALPFLALVAARAEGARIASPLAALAGLGAGVMIALKPPYALAIGFPALWLVSRVGWRALIAAPELWVAALLVGAYVGATPYAFPAFVTNVLPFDVDIYARIRAPLVELLTAPSALAAYGLALALFVLARGLGAARLVPPLALAALGAFGAYLVQGKGWVYHIYPTIAFLALAIGVACEAAAREETRERVAYGVAAIVAIAIVATARGPLAFAIVGGVGGYGYCKWRRPKTDNSTDESVKLMALMAAAAALGMVGALNTLEGLSLPNASRVLREIGPHPTIGAITESLALGHPLTREVNGVWAQRGLGLAMTAGALRLISEHPGDKALPLRLAPYVQRERQGLIDDLTRNRPDALLIGRIGAPAVTRALADPAFRAIRSGYERVAVDGDKLWPTEIWVRKGLLALRPALAAEAARQ